MTDSKETELEPCGCGGDAELRDDHDEDPQRPHWVCCMSCTVGTGPWHDPFDAGDEWNISRSPDTARLFKEREELVKMLEASVQMLGDYLSVQEYRRLRGPNLALTIELIDQQIDKARALLARLTEGTQNEDVLTNRHKDQA